MAVGVRDPGGAASGPTTPPRLATGAVEDTKFAERGLTPAPAWELAIVGWDDLVARSAGADAAGESVVAFDPVPQDRMWHIERLAFETDSVATTNLRVYAGAVDPTNLRARSDAGNGGHLECTKPIRIKAGAHLTIRWSGADPGAIGVVTVQLVAVMAAPRRRSW